MRAILIIALGLLLVFGCAGPAEQPPQPPPQQPPAEPGPPADNATTMTCEEYCPTQPHIQCVGQWNISGTYPDCTCGFICDVSEVEEEPEEEVPEEEEPSAEVTNKTLGEMMDDAMSKVRTDFYRGNSGSFLENSYTWKRKRDDLPPGAIGVDQAPASDVTFDSQAINSIQASGFTVFTNTDTDEKDAYGFATFASLTTILDTYTGSDAFDIWYFPSLIDKDLRDCWVYEKVIEKNEAGDWLSTHYFQCERVYDK